MKYLHLFSNKNKFDYNSDSNKKNIEAIGNNYSYKCFFISNGKLAVISKELFFLTCNKDDIKKLNINQKNQYILGKEKNTIIAGFSVSEGKLKKILFNKSFTLTDIRECFNLAKKTIIPYISSLYSLTKWHKNNVFCALCGSKNISSDLGHSLKCSSISCRNKIFPRIDPTVIMLIRNEDKILLARNAIWKKKLYSCLAGFSEPNESLEETVERETYEEVGLNIHNINYKFSQFWPISNNLMIGFEATSNSLDLKINRLEIEDAIWVTKKQLLKLSKDKEIILPKKYAIAFCLIENWLRK